jgi:hypothetical protein
MSWKLELLRTLTNMGRIGVQAAAAQQPRKAKRRTKGCTPCEAMARVDAARAQAKAARAGEL